MRRYLTALCLFAAQYSQAVEIIAHRGYTCAGDQNTVHSIENAWAVGADAVEIDLRVSNDGVVYLFHDDTISDIDLASLSYSQVEKHAGHRAPMLLSVLKLGEPPGYYVFDLKESQPDRIREIANVIAKSGLQNGHIAFQSENLAVLELLGGLLPEARLFYLTHLKRRFPYLSSPGARSVIRRLSRVKVDGISLKGRRFIDAAFITNLKSAGYRVNVWTINNPIRAAHYTDIGIDGIITDNVEEIQGSRDCGTAAFNDILPK